MIFIKEIKQTQRRIKIKKIASVGVMFTLVLSLVFALITIYANNVGNYVIEIKNSPKNISLSETKEFLEPTSVIQVKGIDNLTNINGDYIDELTITSKDGSANDGNRFMAHTFYLKNMSDVTIDYRYEINITDVTKKMDSAIRFRIIQEGEPSVTYAKPQEQGNIGSPEPGTVPFVSRMRVVEKQKGNFKSGEIHKYTIIIYLEGNDPECLDTLLNSTMKMNMKFIIN